MRFGCGFTTSRIGRFIGIRKPTDGSGSRSGSRRHLASGYYSLPASGYRNRDSGALTSTGDWGGSWSSSPNAADSPNAGNLNFNSGNVNPLNNNNRAYGFPVRCVKYLHCLLRKNKLLNQAVRIRVPRGQRPPGECLVNPVTLR